jgi:hypothetical protein
MPQHRCLACLADYRDPEEVTRPLFIADGAECETEKLPVRVPSLFGELSLPITH